jgi:hypothetical protein
MTNGNFRSTPISGNIKRCQLLLLWANCRNRNRSITGTSARGQEHARGGCNALLICAANASVEGIMKTSLRPAATPSSQCRSRPRVNDRPYPKTRPSGQHPRRQFLRLAVGAAALPAMSRMASAQTYPVKPVRILVGFAAGGSTDLVARLMGQWLSERLGRQFIIENRPGAASNIATEAVVRAPPRSSRRVRTLVTRMARSRPVR